MMMLAQPVVEFQHPSPPFHSVIRIHLISLSYHILVILPSHFSSMEQMFMLMLLYLFSAELCCFMYSFSTSVVLFYVFI